MSDNTTAAQPSPLSFDSLEGIQAGGLRPEPSVLGPEDQGPVEGPAGAIPFVYGYLDPDLVPVEKIITATERAVRARGRLALQYGPEQLIHGTAQLLLGILDCRHLSYGFSISFMDEARKGGKLAVEVLYRLDEIAKVHYNDTRFILRG